MDIKVAQTNLMHLMFWGGFETMLDEGGLPIPRLWYDMLLYAESLRTIKRDDREMAAVRRLMKRACSFMFNNYMDIIRS